MVVVAAVVVVDGLPAGVAEHDDRVTVRKKKGRGTFRWWGEGGHKSRNRGPNPRSRFEDDDGDVAMNDHEPPRVRSVPYSVRANRRGDTWHNRDGPSHIQVTVKQNSDRGSGSGSSGRKTWFKVVIPFGKKYEKSWLLSSIQNLCSVPFTPTEFHFEGNRVVFYVEDSTTANALKQVSRKITDKDKYKVVIQANPSVAPSSVTHELRAEDIEHIKNCMGKRYDVSQHALDLNSLRNDPDLISQNIDVMLNRRNCMHTVVKIIEQHIPELLSLNLGNNKLSRLEDMMDLKAPALKILNLSRNEVKLERDLDKIKSFKLEELWLEGNPLCDNYRDQTAYVRSVLTWPRRLSPGK
uniref:Nuclear RNA export factor 1 n=1 Tax=Callorhinchus milii TaxID=7868 RepID=V9KZI8_CALMI